MNNSSGDCKCQHNDDISDIAEANPPISLPPHTRAVHNDLVQSLNEISDICDTVYREIYDDVSTLVDTAETEIVTTIAEVVGEVDNAQIAQTKAIESVTDKVYSDLAKQITSLEVDLIGNDIGIPVSTDDMVADMSDDTGQWIFERISGNSGTLSNGNVNGQASTPTINAPNGGGVGGTGGGGNGGDIVECKIDPVTGEITCDGPPIGDGPCVPGTTCWIHWDGDGSRIDGNCPNDISGWTQYDLMPDDMGGVFKYYRCNDIIDEPPPPPDCPPECIPYCPPVDCPPPDECPPPCCPEVIVNLPPPPPPPPPPDDCVAVPIIPALPKPPDKVPLKPSQIEWWRPDVCKQMENIRLTLEGEFNVPAGDWEAMGTRAAELFNGLVDTTAGVYAVPGSVLPTLDDEFIKSMRDKAARELADKGISKASIKKHLIDAGKAGKTTPNPMVPLGIVIASAANVERYSMFPATYLAQQELYLFQSYFPQYIPSPAELNAQVLSGQIDVETWECLQKAHGNIPQMHWKTVRAQQTRPNVHETIDLWRRGYFDAIGGPDTQLQQLGIIDPIYADQFKVLSQFIPGPSDLVRFMVRDVFDPNVVEKYDLDKDFELKFYGPGGAALPGPAAQWARAQGMTEVQFRQFWRAHWDIPSNTALYEMQSRLRPDRPEYQQWIAAYDAWLNGGQFGDAPPQPPVVFPADVQRAIEVNDMSPGWVKPLMEIAYVPLTRTDAVRAYEIGVLDDADLYHVMRDNRYNDHDASTLVTFYRQQRQRRVSNASGVWSIRKVLNSYRAGEINRATASDLLAPLMYNPQHITNALDGVDREVEALVVKQRLKALRRGFFVGEFSVADVKQQMALIPLDLPRIVQLIEIWIADRDGRFKEASIRQLREWAVNNIITIDEYFTRLKRLGYNTADANRIIYSSAKYSFDKSQREYKQTVRELYAEYKDVKAARKASKDALEKRLKEMEKEQERIQKVLKERGGGGEPG